MKNQSLAKPPAVNYLKEIRAVKDIALIPVHLMVSNLSKCRQATKKTPVLLIPGVGASDKIMIPFKKYLKNAGYECFGWEMGTNLAGLNQSFDETQLTWDIDRTRKNKGELGVPYLCDRMVTRVKQISEETKNSVAIVGWSLGGCIAREVARDIPQQVKCVVTLGTPVKGGPKYTSTSSQLTKRGLDMDWIEQEVHKRDQNPISRPITAIVSKSDGIVGFRATTDNISLDVEHVEIDIAHLGMVFNKRAWDITLATLNKYEEQN